MTRAATFGRELVLGAGDAFVGARVKRRTNGAGGAPVRYVITKGQVKLVVGTPRGQERILAVCGPGDMIGEAFVLDQERYRVVAVTLEEVGSCPMTREQFGRLAERSATFAVTFAAVLAASLFRCRDQLAQAYDPIRVRVSKLLVEQGQRCGVREPSGWHRLDTRLRHEGLAALAEDA